jgi:hypothetical protein
MQPPPADMPHDGFRLPPIDEGFGPLPPEPEVGVQPRFGEGGFRFSGFGGGTGGYQGPPTAAGGGTGDGFEEDESEGESLIQGGGRRADTPRPAGRYALRDRDGGLERGYEDEDEDDVEMAFDGWRPEVAPRRRRRYQAYAEDEDDDGDVRMRVPYVFD